MVGILFVLTLLLNIDILYYIDMLSNLCAYDLLRAVTLLM